VSEATWPLLSRGAQFTESVCPRGTRQALAACKRHRRAESVQQSSALPCRRRVRNVSETVENLSKIGCPGTNPPGTNPPDFDKLSLFSATLAPETTAVEISEPRLGHCNYYLGLRAAFLRGQRPCAHGITRLRRVASPLETHLRQYQSRLLLRRLEVSCQTRVGFATQVADASGEENAIRVRRRFHSAGRRHCQF